MREDNPPGAYLGREGQVTCRLLEAEEGRAQDAVSPYISVDPITGKLCAQRCSDRK